MQRAKRRVSLPLSVAVASAALATWSAMAAQSAASIADEQLRFERTVVTKNVVIDALAALDVAGLKSLEVLESVERVSEDPANDREGLANESDELNKDLDAFLVSSNKAAVYVLGNHPVSASLATLQEKVASVQENTRLLVAGVRAGDGSAERLKRAVRDEWSDLAEAALIARKITACEYVTDPAWDRGGWSERCGALPSL